jgi:hypothetical protein
LLLCMIALDLFATSVMCAIYAWELPCRRQPVLLQLRSVQRLHSKMKPNIYQFYLTNVALERPALKYHVALESHIKFLMLDIKII